MGTDIVALRAQLADQAKAAASSIRGGQQGQFLSLKGGVLSLDDEEMPGSQICVVVVDYYFENTFYSAKYQSGVKDSPVCYAFARGHDEMFPHESMQDDLSYFKPQNMDESGNVFGCKTCPKNQWGSSGTSMAKACQNRMRLTLLPAGYYAQRKGSRDLDLEMYSDPRDLAGDLFYLKLPPTSVVLFEKYVSQLVAAHNVPPHGVITRVYTEPHKSNQFAVKFEMIEKVPDDLLVTVMARHSEAASMPFQPYKAPEANATQQHSQISGLRRRT